MNYGPYGNVTLINLSEGIYIFIKRYWRITNVEYDIDSYTLFLQMPCLRCRGSPDTSQSWIKRLTGC